MIKNINYKWHIFCIILVPTVIIVVLIILIFQQILNQKLNFKNRKINKYANCNEFLLNSNDQNLNSDLEKLLKILKNKFILNPQTPLMQNLKLEYKIHKGKFGEHWTASSLIINNNSKSTFYESNKQEQTKTFVIKFFTLKNHNYYSNEINSLLLCTNKHPNIVECYGSLFYPIDRPVSQLYLYQVYFFFIFYIL